jgi:hypothetical protein
VLDARHHGFQAVSAGRGAEHEINVRVCGKRREPLGSRSGKGDTCEWSTAGKPIERSGRSHCDGPGFVAGNLLGKPLVVFTGRKRDDRKTIGVRVDHSESALSNRPGRSEDREACEARPAVHERAISM